MRMLRENINRENKKNSQSTKNSTRQNSSYTVNLLHNLDTASLPSHAPGSTLPPPALRLITAPEPAYAPQDTNATFTCSGSSSAPGFSIVWQRNGIPLSSNELDGIIFTVTQNGSVVSSELTVLISVEDDGDNFTCVLLAISGTLVSEPARLNSESACARLSVIMRYTITLTHVHHHTL